MELTNRLSQDLSCRVIEQYPMSVAYVSLAELLIARPGGIAEMETWALLCQAVQALQDLFLSDDVSSSRSGTVLSPATILLCSKGRVLLAPGRITCSSVYAAPEYQPHVTTTTPYTENDIEKMLIFSLGECLKRATFMSNSVTMRLSRELCQILITMSRQPASERATLMHLLDVISKYSNNRREFSKPFSHVVMDLYQETIIYQNNHPVLQEDCAFQPHVHKQHVMLPYTDRNDLIRIENSDNCKAKSKWTSPLDYSKCTGNAYSLECLNAIPENQTQNPKSTFKQEDKNIQRKLYTHKKEKTNRNPVKRAASRLYNVIDDNVKIRPCIGPEFVIRAALASKQIIIDDIPFGQEKILTVIMLNGVKLEIICKPESTTAGKLFEEIIRNEHIEENYFLGLSVLICGDFVFLPADVKLSKLLTSEVASNGRVTLYIRVRFFLPSLRGIRSQQTRHLLYLQLRRSLLENHLSCSDDQIFELGGLALQAEFGDYLEKHETNHYFLLEHYLPETVIGNSNNLEQLQQNLTQTHMQRSGLSVEKSEEHFILLAQSLPYYGVHFYAGTLISKTINRRVWLCISAQGINLLVRNDFEIPTDRSLIYDTFKWQAIQTLCYSKHYLCILPHNTAARQSLPRKYKLKMEHKKSYYTFRLASLHHQFSLRLRTEYNSIQSLSQQFGVLLKDIKNESNSLFKLASHNLKEYNKSDHQLTCSVKMNNYFGNRSSSCKRSKSVNELTYNMRLEGYQNIENEHSTEVAGYMNRMCDKRKGVKMGTKVISSNGQRICRSLETINIWNTDTEKLSLNSASTSISSSDTEHRTPNTDVYILDSSIKSLDDQFLPNFHETLSDSLAAKLKNMSFADERILKSITIHRDENGSLGIQVTEGSDGKAYIQSVVPYGPAIATGQIFKGDQIVAVNKRNLLNIKYSDALKLLKGTDDTVELLLSQNSQSQHLETAENTYLNHSISTPSCEYENQMLYNLNFTVKNYSNSKCNDILQKPPTEENKIGIRPLKQLKECVLLTSINNYSNDQMDVSHIAFPRSLGLGRRWRGPVRYPVTPMKNQEKEQNK